jgi:hypothetical protein
MTRTIGFLCDPHIVGGDRRDHDGVAQARGAIEKLNEVGVDWTLLGGDLRSFTVPTAEESSPYTGWGTWNDDADNYHFREDYAKAKRLFDEELDSEYFVIRGNNDRPLAVFREFFPEDEFPLWYWFVDGGVRYVFLDSNPSEGYHILDERQNFVSAPQLSMLERLMDDDPEIPTFVFCHTPLAKHTEIRDDWETGRMGAQFITLNYLSVQRVLERGNTVMVNTGHYYGGEGRGHKCVEGIEYVNARHLTHSHDAEYAGDVRWITVDEDEQTATVHFYDVGADEEGTIVTTSW